MKVGTDGVLLGAWTGTGVPTRILEIGAGCGVVSLMLAQRFPSATIDAVEIQQESAEEAKQNFQTSPWHSRLQILCVDVRGFQSANRYDLIVSNPPWYDTEMKPPENARSTARHSDSLSSEELVTSVTRLLHPEGQLSVIIPVAKAPRLIAATDGAQLELRRQTRVRPNALLPPHRVLMEFSRVGSKLHVERALEELTIESSVRHDYTPEYKSLLRDFMLRF